jgi:hypothetical protein
MSNHVHLLLLPKIAPSRLLQSLKGVTAREANPILGRTGELFWHAESYDHWVRDDEEWKRIAAYIEDNPVKAGLVQRADLYRWSSAGAPAKSAGMSLGAADRRGSCNIRRTACLRARLGMAAQCLQGPTEP